MHRLQMFPNLALNPMERKDNIICEFYTLKNHNKHGVEKLLKLFMEVMLRTKKMTQCS